MREFNLDLLIGKDVAVNCRTKKEEAEFLAYLDNKAIKWCNGNNIFDNNDYNFSYYNKNTCFCINDDNHLSHSELSFYLDTLEYKIIYLDELIKPKNNFKEYGFEADFEGEILKEVDGIYLGYVIDNGHIEMLKIYKDGSAYGNGTKGKYDLKPVKKEWYEKEDTFALAVRQIKDLDDNSPVLGKICIMQKITDNEGDCLYSLISGGHVPKHRLECFRPATKEEVLSLLVKD